MLQLRKPKNNGCQPFAIVKVGPGKHEVISACSEKELKIALREKGYKSNVKATGTRDSKTLVSSKKKAVSKVLVKAKEKLISSVKQKGDTAKGLLRSRASQKSK